jgi:hypothetical protein
MSEREELLRVATAIFAADYGSWTHETSEAWMERAEERAVRRARDLIRVVEQARADAEPEPAS